MQVIRVPTDFDAREGLKLTPEYTIGKEIGGGVQGRVLALNGPNGEKTNKLLKVLRLPYLGIGLLLCMDNSFKITIIRLHCCNEP